MRGSVKVLLVSLAVGQVGALLLWAVWHGPLGWAIVGGLVWGLLVFPAIAQIGVWFKVLDHRWPEKKAHRKKDAMAPLTKAHLKRRSD